MQEETKRQTDPCQYRLTKEVAEKLRKLQEEEGLTYNGLFNALATTYELGKAKAMIADRETEIANFQMKLTEISEAFVHSLQLNQDAEARARAEVAALIESKDETIIELQKRVADLKEKNAKTSAEADETKNANKNLIDELSVVKNAEIEAKKALGDKERIISMQENQLEDLAAAKEAAANAEARAEAYRIDLEGARAHIVELGNAKDAAERAKLELSEQLNKVNAEHEKAIETFTKNLARDLEVASERAENAKRAAVLDAQEKAQQKFDSYMAKMDTKLEARDDEIAKLRAELMDLKLQMPKKAAEKPEKDEKSNQVALDVDC